MLQKPLNVISAKPAPEASGPGAGIQVLQGLPGPGCHGRDRFVEFCKRFDRVNFLRRIETGLFAQDSKPFE